MLQVAFLRENTQEAIDRLAIRNMDAKAAINEILGLDDKRRQSQLELDNLLAEGNRISKEIGEFFKAGKQAEASVLKSRTTEIKEQSKKIEETLTQAEEDLKKILRPDLAPEAALAAAAAPLPRTLERMSHRTALRRHRRTKMIATLGPASATVEIIERLFRAGCPLTGKTITVSDCALISSVFPTCPG